MSQEKKRIIVADDDAGILDSLCILLEFAGYEVQCTSNGTDLLNMMAPYPDLVLLDIWMSGVDGRDICKQLKQQPHTLNIPIIMISASNDIGFSAISAGADDFVAKPFHMDTLLDIIQRNLDAT